ncbi:hypothetical protein EV426DRAFT_255726 [Tirmania nivea]|nr:hypothetical protein EV426DRAFT_255726 [Tirmania nivea]
MIPAAHTMFPFQKHNTSRPNVERWGEGLQLYSGCTISRRSSLKKQVKRLSRAITGSTSSQPSSSCSSNEDSKNYSAVHMIVTTGIGTAAGSPAAVSSAGISPTANNPSHSPTWNNECGYSLVAATLAAGSPTAVQSVGSSLNRCSVSSTIRNFFESRSSLASSSRWSTSAIMSGLQEENDQLPDLQEENNELLNEAIIMESEVVDMMEPTISYGPEVGDDVDMATQASSSNHLRVPERRPQGLGLRIQPSLQSISTIGTEVSWAGSWDEASEVYSQNTDIACEDDGGGSRGLGKMSLHSESNAIVWKHTGIKSQIQDAQAGSGACDPLYILSKAAELLEHVLGYLTPSDIINLQLSWDYLLHHSSVYHTLIRQRYHHIRPVPGDTQTTRTFEDLKRTVKQDKAIKEGRLSLVTQLDVPVHVPRVRYHSGYLCFNQELSGTSQSKGKSKYRDSHEIWVYNFRQGKEDPAVFPCSTESKLLSVTLGGGAGNGVHLVYCEVDENLHASISCYFLPSCKKKWQTTFPPHLVLSGIDRLIIQTNGLLTVVAVKDRIIAWDEKGRHIRDIVLLPEQANFQAKKGGRLYLSNNHIYLATWGAGEATTITAYCNRTFKLVMNHHLGISGSVVQVSGLFLSGKLYLAVACALSGLCSTWSSFSVDDKCPSTIKPVENFPKLNERSNANIVWYPHHERVYIISHSNFQHRNPTSNLSIVNISIGVEKRLTEEQGYLSDLVIDGDCSTSPPLQGDNEFMILCTKGKMKVYRFDYDHYDRVWA